MGSNPVIALLPVLPSPGPAPRLLKNRLYCGVATPQYSLFFNNRGAGPGDGNTGSNAITGLDPMFVGASDFHLQSSSPAKGAGTATGAPTVDLDGKTRPNPPAIGAFEPISRVVSDFNGDVKSDVLWRKS